MKRNFLIALIISSCFVYVNCGKKSDTPSPSIGVQNPVNNTNLNKDSVTFSVKNTTVVYKLTSLDTLYKGTYFKANLSGGLGGSLIYLFNTKPTANYSYTFGTGSFPYPIQIIHSSFDSWDATSGIVNVEVSASKIIVSFTDVVFKNRADQTTKTCSGYLSTYKWKQ